MSPILLSNSLTVLADQVRERHDQLLRAQRTSAEKAIEAGRLLIAAKAECQHGEWLPFLQRAGVNERTARNYMRLADSGIKSDTVADLGGLRATLEFLSRWQMPEYGKALFVSDAKFDGSYAETQTVGRGIAYVWESDQHRGFFNVGVIVGSGGDDAPDDCVWTKRPMAPRLEADGDHGPVDLILHVLCEWLGPSLPISDWQIGFVDSTLPPIVLPPFQSDGAGRKASNALDSAGLERG